MKNNQEEYLRNSFELWQTYSQEYTDFVIEAMQQSLNQMLTFRERVDQVVVDAMEKFQTLNAQERGLALDMATAFNVQAQVAAEHSAELFKTVSGLMMAPLFSDWAAERAARMSAAASATKK